MRRVGTIIFLILSVAGSCRAEQSACLQRTIPVSFSSSDRSPIPELQVGNLEGTYEKRPVLVESVELEKTPPRVILLVDTSGSMGKHVDATIDAAEGVLASLPAGIQVGLAFFAVDTIPVVPLTTDRKVLIFQLESLRRNRASFRSYTALWSALIQTVKMLKTPRAGDAIYLVSDGGENKSPESERTVITSLAGGGVRLFALILTSAGIRGRSAEELAGPIEIQKLVGSTGGNLIVTTEGDNPYSKRAVFVGKNGSPTQLGQSVSQQLDQLLRFYQIQISLPELVDKPRDWKLRFVGAGKDKVILTYPRMLSPYS